MSAVPEQVRLSIPAAPEHVVLARLTAAGFASRSGADVEVVDDLKIVVTEMCGLVLESDPTGPLELVFDVRADLALHVTVTCSGGAGAPGAADELAHALIRSLTDEFTVDDGDGRLEMVAVKRLAG